MKDRIIISIVIVILIINSLFLLFFPTQLYTQEEDCDSSYPHVCIPPSPPDLNCSDISDKNFKVEYPDPHGFDREGDGIGCEK